MKKISLFTLIVIGLFTSCTEDIDLNIVGGETTIVVEGSIEKGEFATVVLTRNSLVSETVDFEDLIVTDAQVLVSNGNITDTLLLSTGELDPSLTLGYAYKGNKIKGVAGETYQLTIISEGNTYTASATIPTPIQLDSVWFQAQPPHLDSGYVHYNLTDPVGFGNAYRWTAKVAGKDRRYLAPGGSTFDDKFIDGISFPAYYDPGKDATSEGDDGGGNPFENLYSIKDTVYIKFSSIDYATYRFFVTYETSYQNNGNPFASPTSVAHNISNDGLGIWAGYGVTYDTIIPPQ